MNCNKHKSDAKIINIKWEFITEIEEMYLFQCVVLRSRRARNGYSSFLDK
jgi:hypothetical protein